MPSVCHHARQSRRHSLPFLVSASCLLAILPRDAAAIIDVWIDPGHGGVDGGAPGFDGDDPPNEKQLTIAVSDFLEGDLTAFAYIVRKTQNSDSTYFSLSQRAQIANGELENDEGFRDSCRLFMSIHMNSAASAAAFGTETYYPTIKYGAKKKTAYQADSTAAKRIHQGLMANADVAFLFCSNDRGIKRKNYQVLRETTPRAILIEVCFVSNQCQFNNIITAGDQALIADGIAAGVTNVLTAASEPPLEAPSRDVAAPARGNDGLDVQQRPTSFVRGAVLQEGFDGATLPPTGWSVQTSGAPVPFRWHRTAAPLYINTGAGAALVGGEYASANDESLISPGVPLGATDGAIAFSWMGSRQWAGAVDATCSIRQQGTSTWTQLWSLAAAEPPADPFLCRQRIVDISAWTGQTVEFRFRVAGTNGADFGLDDVLVGDFDPTAPAANDLCVNATPLGSSFVVDDVTCYAVNDLDPYTGPPNSCVGNEMGGPDVFYALSVAAGDTLEASIVAEWGPGLYVIDACSPATCLAGLYAEDGRVLPALTYEFPASGTYYLVVDGDAGSCGPFELTGAIHPTAVGVIESPRKDGRAALLALPNPSRNTVLVRGRLREGGAGAAILTIYDIGGKKIIEKGVDRTGAELAYEWDGCDTHGIRVGAGTYFIRVRAGADVLEAKVTLLR